MHRRRPIYGKGMMVIAGLLNVTVVEALSVLYCAATVTLPVEVNVTGITTLAWKEVLLPDVLKISARVSSAASPPPEKLIHPLPPPPPAVKITSARPDDPMVAVAVGTPGAV